MIITSLSKTKEKGRKKRKRERKNEKKGKEKKEKEKKGKKKKVEMVFCSHRIISKTFLGKKSYFLPRGKEYHIFSRYECF